MEFRAYLSQLADCDLSVYSRLEPAEVSVTRKRFWLDCDHNAQVRRPDFHYRRLRPLEVEQNLERLEQLRLDRLELTGVERELGTWIWEDVWTKNQALQALIRYQGAATQAKERRWWGDNFRFWDYQVDGTEPGTGEWGGNASFGALPTATGDGVSFRRAGAGAFSAVFTASAGRPAGVYGDGSGESLEPDSQDELPDSV